MPYYSRDLEATLLRFAKFPVVALLGPRQSGKSTLAKKVFAQHTFINLEDLELRALANNDPKAFLRSYDNSHGIILDEFQNCPELLSYIQVIVDANDRPGYFVLTGSQNFLMSEAISQSLAGRVGILTLLPFSINELRRHELLGAHANELIFNGGYPRLYSGFTPEETYPSYIKTYIERDVRQLINVTNILTFQKFIKLCAARIGQLLNYSDLANSCDISVPTVHQWLAILEASYIIFLLRPHWENFNKRVTKTPKLYFYDTGLVCSLLEISSAKALLLNPLYGNLFECMVIADLHKQYYNRGRNAPLYFWRDKNGTIEVDCLINKDAQLIPIEIKSGETYNQRYFDQLTKWVDCAKQADVPRFVVYGGSQQQKSDQEQLVPWYLFGDFATKFD